MRAKPNTSLDPLQSALPDQYRRWLRACLWLILAGYFLLSMTQLVSGGVAMFLASRDIYASAICGFALLLERRSHLQPAAWLGVGTLWVEAMMTLIRDGLGATSTPVFPGLIVGVGALLGARMAWIVAVLSVVTIPLFVYLGGELGLGPGLQLQRMSHLLVLLINVLGCAALLNVVMRSFDLLLKRTRQQAAQAAEMIDCAPDAMVVFDEELRVAEFNPAAERALGVSRTEVLGRLITALPLQDAGGRALENVRDFETTLTGPTQLIAPNTTRHLEALFRRTHHSSRAQRFMMVLRDTTQQRLAEQRSKELQVQLQHAQKLEALGLLAGGVAHDFNNLLTTVAGYATLIGRSTDEKAREYAAELLGAQERGASLTRQLLSFARKEVVQRKLLDLAQLLEGMRSLLQRLLGEHVALVTELSGPLPLVADAGQIEQIMLNLAANARDAMPKGGTLWVRCRAEGSDVALVVEDNGAGIEPETLQRVFEPFFTTKPRGRGTGLGLSTVHGIVTDSGGQLSVKSTPGTGTRFELRWPRAVPQAQTELFSPLPAAKPRGRILLAEDDESNRRFLVRLLSDAGYDVDAACDGHQALTLVEASPTAPQLLLTDVMMPGITGVTLAKRIHERYPLLPVLFISGYLDDVLDDAPYDAAVDLLLKPYDADELLRRIETKISARA